MGGNSIVIFLLLLLTGLVSAAQEEHEMEWENTAAGQESAIPIDWDDLTKRRFNVNSINEEELSSLIMLTPIQIRDFLVYRKKYGDFISLMELQAIPSWDLQILHKIMPYFTLSIEQPLAPELKQRLLEGTHRILFRTAGRGKKDSSGFMESSQLLSHRFQFRDLLQTGLTIEKDAGEKRIPDHLSLFIGLGNKGILKKLLIGDFTVKMGQGLIHWQGYALGQSTNLITGYRQGMIFRPHTGTDENRFHRGVAVSLQKKKWELSGFVSSQKIDARILTDSVANFTWASTLQTSGLHRTAGELAGRKSLRWQSLGARVRYQHQQFSSSLNYVLHCFGNPLLKESTPYNLHALSGSLIQLVSLDQSIFSKWGFFFAETALKPMESLAFISGWMKSLDTRFDLSVLGRMIGRQFNAFQSNSLTSSGESKDEKGIFLNFNLHPNPQHQLDGYIDRFRCMDPGYGIDGIQYGSSFSLQYKWVPQKRVECAIRWSHGNSNQNREIPENKSNGLPFVETDHWRTHFSLKPDLTWAIRVRNEWSRITIPAKATETGQFHYTEVIYAPPLKPFSMSMRASFFETGGYASRIYAYERDVLGYYSVPAHDGKGSRYYALMQHKWKSGHSLSGKLILDQRKGETQWNWRLQWIWEL